MSTTLDGSPALELHRVSKTYGAKQAVKELSMTVQRGELVCLLGPNGAGKTTTIEMCEGFIAPTCGEISVLGMNPAKNPDAVRARIGIMLQGGGSYSGIKVREMLKLAASYNVDPHDPDWLIEILGLGGVANNSYRRLSGGQQQRLSLALALIGRPELIFLDEPTAGMDAQSRLAVWELVRSLKRDGTSVVLTTHLMDEAEALADKVVIIDHGEQVAAGTPAELMGSRKDKAVTISTTTELDIARFTRDTGYEAQAVRPLHYRIQAPASPALIAEFASALVDQNVLAHRIDTAQQTLEDVFLDITGRELRS